MTQNYLILAGKILIPLAYSLLEYWLGKTTKVKANSMLELAIDFFLKKRK